MIERSMGGIAKRTDAIAFAADIEYPVNAKPYYVLGGRAMEIICSNDKLVTYLENAVEVNPKQPVLIDKYSSVSIEIDVNALTDTEGSVLIGGIMEHRAGWGSLWQFSLLIVPKIILSSCLEIISSWTTKLAKRLNVCGWLMNCQYAISAAGKVFFLEANPRALGTVPFVSKAIGHPLAKYASLVMSGKS
ncbi:hypothetical protein Nepgr_010211 [Nepenthes gracilis]|uniref:carbamoyl-phosphate synthase (ammonia) n=1 Tax=Nepenthes gracilis TaxID=150966 RepID=A0AAD3XL59_NEPGR|nr:hypothetical protein Nepgr_010211 [Nepenthes gracilis]